MIKQNTWIALIVLMLLLVTMVIWQGVATNEEIDVIPTSTSSLLLPQLDVGKIVAFTLQRSEGNETLILEKDETGGWVLKQPASELTDSASVDANLSQLASIRILSAPMLDVGLEDLGLKPPMYRLLIQLEDGQQLILNVGSETPTGSGYYVLTPERRIVIVNKFTLDAIIAMLDQPPILEPTPTPSPTVEPTSEVEGISTETPSVEPPNQEVTPTP